jgi:hypothetical protein
VRLRPALFAPVVLFAVASLALASDALVGDWAGENNGVEMTVHFRADGTFELADMKGKWRRDGQKLTLVDEDDDAETYRVEIQGDRLSLSGGDLPRALTFKRKGQREAAPAPRKPGFKEALERALAGAETKPAAAPLSRPPQAKLEGVKKYTPKFKSATKEIKDAEGKYTFKVPEKWTLLDSGQDANARWAAVNPGYGPGDIAKHQIVFWQVPVLPADAAKGFTERVEEGARKLDQLYPTFKRGKTEIFDAPNGLIGRVEYSGNLTNELVQNAPVVSSVAVRQVKHYYLAVTILSLKEAAGELDDDALAVLDAAVLVLKDRDREAEKALVGTWVVPTKQKAHASSLETYQFNADGTFRWDFEGSVVATYRDPTDSTVIRAQASAASVDQEVGRYEIRGDTIYFTSNKGEQGCFYRTWTEGTRRFLQVGRATFVR